MGEVEGSGLFSHADMEVVVIEASVSGEPFVRVAVRFVRGVAKDTNLFGAALHALVNLYNGRVIPLHCNMACKAVHSDRGLFGSSIDLGRDSQRLVGPEDVALLWQRVVGTRDADLEDGGGEEAQCPLEALLVGKLEGVRRLLARRREIRQRPFYEHDGGCLCRRRCSTLEK